MTIAEAFLAEFNHESQTTRKFLERVPQDQLTWAPHEKSMTAGQLAFHIAFAPGLVAGFALQNEVTPPDFTKPNPQPQSASEILTTFEESIAKVNSILKTLDDNHMVETWRVIVDGKEVMALPRAGMVRNLLFNHIYHHRGQLGVYLRLLGAKVPMTYGPSADEMPDFMPK